MTTHFSPWLSSGHQTNFPRFEKSEVTQVAVLGGGISGLMTAVLLQQRGANVTLLESLKVGGGTTGGSTGKVTSLHGKIYQLVERDFGEEGARTYAEANQGGLALIASLVEEVGIECGFERRPAYTYTAEAEMVDTVRAESEAARRAGLPASFVTEADVPFEILGAVRVEDQAQFDPYRFCVGLAHELERLGGKVYENSRALDVEESDTMCTVKTEGGALRAQHVVVATLLPFLDRGGFFAKASPSRSYGVVASIEGPPPEGMYLSAEEPRRSARSFGDKLIVVGEDHKTGQDDDTRRRYEALEDWARKWYTVRSIDNRWSAQDFMPVDGVPYIGRMPMGGERLLVATGYQKWGLSASGAAAEILVELVQGKQHPWLQLFDATRADVTASATKLVSENLNVAKRFVGDRLKALAPKELAELKPGEGGIVKMDGESVAAFRDDNGAVHAVSPVCTHMGCHVTWNSAERTWDCPCHGSRFKTDGSIVDGPAVQSLERKNPASK